MLKKPVFRLLILAIIALSALNAQAPQRPEKQDKIRHLIFKLDFHDLFPDRVVVDEGWYMIRLVNGVITRELDVQVDDDKGASLGKAKAPERRAKTTLLVHLKPGKSVISIPGNSRWRSEIVVEAKKD